AKARAETYTLSLHDALPIFGTPDAGVFWRVVDDHRVNVMFTAPTAIRAIRRVDPELELLPAHDIGSLRVLFLAGERLDPETFHRSEEHTSELQSRENLVCRL